RRVETGRSTFLRLAASSESRAWGFGAHLEYHHHARGPFPLPTTEEWGEGQGEGPRREREQRTSAMVHQDAPWVLGLRIDTPRSLRFPFNAPDQPDRERDQQDQPPKVTQFARGHFHKRKRPGKHEKQHGDDSQQDSDLKCGSNAWVHLEREDGVGDDEVPGCCLAAGAECLFNSSSESSMFAPPSVPTTSGDLPFQFCRICSRMKSGLSRSAWPRT